MKKLLYLIMAIILPVALYAGNDDAELSHVRVFMNDGSVAEGYITTYWSEKSIFKGLNKAFKMTSVPGGNDERRYTADEVSRVEFLKQIGEKGSDNVISADVANPSTFHPGKITRQFVHVEDSTEHGVIYWWNGLDRQQMQLGTMTVSTIYGVRLAGDDVIIPFMTGNVVSLNAMRILYKKKNKKLVDYIDSRILKGGSRLWSRISQQPMIFLDIVGEAMDGGL